MARVVKGVRHAARKTARTAKPGRTAQGSASSDGRSTRWSEHREARRAELVLAAVAAIDKLGPDAGVGEIAKAAGVSKPVLYRYFTDKADLHAAVGTWGATTVMERLLPAVLSDDAIEDRVRRGCSAYLETIEEHPNVFLLLVAHRAEGAGADGSDPLAGGKAAIAAALARVVGDTLRELGVDAAGAEPWAHGLVGLGLSTGEWWLTRRTMSRAAVTDYLSAFVWHAFEGIARSYGVRIDEQGGLRLVSATVDEVDQGGDHQERSRA